MPRTQVSVQLLGPVRLRRDDQVVPVGGPKQQAVLAVLALHPGEVVTAARLSEAVWGERPPASAATTLRAYVSRLRALLPDGVLDRSGAGWRLEVDRADVDALHAEDLLAQASAADGRAPAERALALWQGEPLTGLHDLPLARTELPRLADLRARGQERLVALMLAQGHARDAVPAAAALVAAHPHRESAVEQLALALARSGRHAEALAAVDALRRRLAEDVGLEPSPRTVDLQRRLLLHDPSVVADDAPHPVPTQPPPGRARPTAGPDDGGGGGPERARLPVPLTSFVGRESDIGAVHAALDRARLVTLVGPGGAGKTRLALEALRRRPDRHVDGPWLVELGWVRPGRVVEAVAQALQLTTPEVAPGAVAAAVHGRRLLLVLDNCEHVVDEVAALVQQLLAECGGLQVLATSREALGVPGEHRHVVDPMTAGRPGAPGEAEALFVERAGSVVGGFRLDETTAAPVSRLVRALDGIPLAVELAAARLSVMGLDDMVGMLDDRLDGAADGRFALLEGGARTSLPHQRTLAAAVEWSHDLLDDQERTLFAVASTFEGPFELAALRGLAEPELDRPVVGVLASLTAKSMVQVDGTADLRASRSYRLLETLRVFGRSVTDPDLARRLARRHAEWFAADADDAFAGLRGPGTRRWLLHLDLVRPDMRAALAHAVREGDRRLALRLVAGLSTYWFHRGHVQEGRTWTAAALALPPGGPAGPAGPEGQESRPGPDGPGVDDETVDARVGLGSALLAYAGGFASGLDDPALLVLDRAARSTADPSSAAVASVYAGYFQAAFGDLGPAQVHFARAAELLATGEVEPWAVAEVLFAQGQLLRAQGKPLEALEVLAECTRTGQACGHAWARGSGRYIAAKVHLDLRQGGPALAVLAEELPSCLDLGIHTSTLAVLHTAAAATALVERHTDAALVLGAVDAVGERLGYSPTRMDPVDAVAHRAMVREGLTEAEYRAAYARGRGLGLAEAVARVVELSRGAARRRAPVAGT